MKHNTTITFLIDTDKKKKLREFADRRGMDVSNFVRFVIFQYVKKEGEQDGRD